MALPLIPVALALGLGWLVSKKGSGSPEPVAKSPGLDQLFEPGIPGDMLAQSAALLSTSQDWQALNNQAVVLYHSGYPKASSSLLAAANYWRQKQGLGPLSYPPVMQTTAIPGPPGMKPIQGIPPAPVQTSQTTTEALPYGTPPFNPSTKAPNPAPDGATTVMLPGGIQVTIPAGAASPFPLPPGIMGQPASMPPAGVPGQPVPTAKQPVPTAKQPQPAPPPAPPKAPTYPTYPAGTHTRPDGTAGYYTQKGDYSVAMIAAKFKGQAGDLMKANPGVAWTKNYEGTDLNLPAAWVSAGKPAPGPRGPNPPGQSSQGQAAPSSPGDAPITELPFGKTLNPVPDNGSEFPFS